MRVAKWHIRTCKHNLSKKLLCTASINSYILTAIMQAFKFMYITCMTLKDGSKHNYYQQSFSTQYMYNTIVQGATVLYIHNYYL